MPSAPLGGAVVTGQGAAVSPPAPFPGLCCGCASSPRPVMLFMDTLQCLLSWPQTHLGQLVWWEAAGIPTAVCCPPSSFSSLAPAVPLSIAQFCYKQCPCLYPSLMLEGLQSGSGVSRPGREGDMRSKKVLAGLTQGTLGASWENLGADALPSQARVGRMAMGAAGPGCAELLPGPVPAWASARLTVGTGQRSGRPAQSPHCWDRCI